MVGIATLLLPEVPEAEALVANGLVVVVLPVQAEAAVVPVAVMVDTAVLAA